MKFLFYCIVVALFCTETTNSSLQLPLPENSSFEDLITKNLLSSYQLGCFSNTDRPDHSINRWLPWDGSWDMASDSNFFNGTTFWINEYMSVGHVMFDIILLEALRRTKVDRIVLQRAPCLQNDLCLGLGTWVSFYRAFYAAVIDAFQPGVGLFVRFVPGVKTIVPIYLTTNTSGDTEYEYKPYHNNFKPHTLTNRNCFERVIMRHHNWRRHTYASVSAGTAARFKESAYKLVRDVTLAHDFEPHPQQPAVRVVLAYRCRQASRRMTNVELMKRIMTASLPPPRYDLHFNCTSSHYLSAVDQIKMVALAHVVIAEHGAFQSNMMFMRKGALFIELRGDYGHGEFSLFEQLAEMFGVAYTHVLTRNLHLHRDIEFNITTDEILSVVNATSNYADLHFINKPTNRTITEN